VKLPSPAPLAKTVADFVINCHFLVAAVAKIYLRYEGNSYFSLYANSCVGDDTDEDEIRRQRPIIKAVPLHAMEALGGRGGIAPTHSRPRH
jgi:hypothetical protein